MSYVLNVKDVGAAGDGITDDTDAIQRAIDLFIDYPKSWNKIWFPVGNYKITRTLVVGRSNRFVCVHMEGQPAAFPDVGAGSSFGAACIAFRDGLQSKQNPVIVFQGQRASTIKGMGFLGANDAPAKLIQAGYSCLFSTSYANWIAADIRENASSPQCPVAIDPFLPGPPGGNPANCYPDLLSYYDPTVFTPVSSSDIQFEDCWFEGGSIGVAICPAGANAGGTDPIQNNENHSFIRCFFQKNRSHFAMGQSQSRAILLDSPRMYGSWFAIVAADAICGPGGNPAQSPMLVSNANVGGCKYIFNCVQNTQPMHVSSMYAESTCSLGRIGFGSTSTNMGAQFDACAFTFLSGSWPGAQGYAEAPFTLESWGLVDFNKTSFSTFNMKGLLRFRNVQGRLRLNDCSFLQDSVNAIVQVGFDTESEVRISTVHIRNGAAVFQDDPIASGRITKADLNNGNIVQVLRVGASSSQGTCTLSSTSTLSVGDLIKIKTNSPTKWIPPLVPPSVYPEFQPVGVVSAVAANSITIEQLPEGFPFADDLILERVRWHA